MRDERERMVDEQLIPRGITNKRVLDAMRNLPRHLFVPDSLRAQAYEDRPLNIGSAQTISQPYMVAAMTSLLELKGTEHVLEIGTGSGYQSAILAQLAQDVVTIERHAELANCAREHLQSAGIDNVTVLVGDGSLGCSDRAPYDAILVTAAAPHVPRALLDQLSDGGRLVCPVGTPELQRLVRCQRVGAQLMQTTSTECIFVPLIGADAWSADAAAHWRDNRDS